MRTLHLLVAAAALAPAAGCNWMKEWREGLDQNRQRGAGKIAPQSPQRAVAYLNRQADSLRSIEYEEVHLRCYGKGVVPLMVDGYVACSQPRNFRMKVKKTAIADVDTGSNQDQFWVYAKLPGSGPFYVFATHDDLAAGRAKAPDGIPFDPEWVMQAFGMTHYDPAARYEEVRFSPDPAAARRPAADAVPADQMTMPISERDRTYTLAWAATAPGGSAIRKEVVFEADSTAGTRPSVKKHIIRDSRNKIITSAEIKSAQTTSVADPATGGQVEVQVPTRVVLKWEEQNFEMDLRLEKAQVNQIQPTDPRPLFALPDVGTRPINLAGATEARPFR